MEPAVNYTKYIRLPKFTFAPRACPAGTVAQLAKIYARSFNRYLPKQTLLSLRLQTAARPPFVLHDGPPYANGDLHLGHMLNKTLKDIAVRHKLLQGYHVDYRPGWDCHGLPIESKVYAEHTSSTETLNRDTIIKKSRSFAAKAISAQRRAFMDWGIAGDWDRTYQTMDRAYTTAQSEIFVQLQAKNLVYKMYRPVYWSPSSQSALAESELEYMNKVDQSVYVEFRLAHDPSLSLLVWTSMPWTLLGNHALAINPDLEYIRVGRSNSSIARDLIVEKTLFHQRLSKGVLAAYEFIVAIAVDQILHKTSALCPLDPYQIHKPILPADFVTNASGTGIVHLAPAHGMIDYTFLIEKGLLPSPTSARPVIEKDGRLTEMSMAQLRELSSSTSRLAAARMISLFANDNDIKSDPCPVLGYLSENSTAIFSHVEPYSHRYAYDWRSKQPVVTMAMDQWFCDLATLKQTANREIKDHIRFIPASAQNRLSAAINARLVWCLSRQRAWGVPIPDSKNTNGDTIDVWFDSGCSWASVLTPKPHERSSSLSEIRQADLIIEGSDQHRGWFQSSLLLSSAIQEVTPYKTCVTHGFVLDAVGNKMSKSLGNVVRPEDLIKTHGLEALRHWIAFSDYTSDISVSPAVLDQANFNIKKIRNTLRYLLGTYAYLPPDAAELNKLSIHANALNLSQLHEIHLLSATVDDHYEQYQFQKVLSAVSHYINHSLSSFIEYTRDSMYLRRLDDPLRIETQRVFNHVLKQLLILLHPILPYTTDEAYHALQRSVGDDLFPRLFEELKATAALSLVLNTPHAPLASDVQLKVESIISPLVYLRSQILKLSQDLKQKESIADTLDLVVVMRLSTSSSSQEENLGMPSLQPIFDELFVNTDFSSQSFNNLACNILVVSRILSEPNESVMHPTPLGSITAYGATIELYNSKLVKCPRCWLRNSQHAKQCCPTCTEQITEYN